MGNCYSEPIYSSNLLLLHINDARKLVKKNIVYYKNNEKILINRIRIFASDKRSCVYCNGNCLNVYCDHDDKIIEICGLG